MNALQCLCLWCLLSLPAGLLLARMARLSTWGDRAGARSVDTYQQD